MSPITVENPFEPAKYMNFLGLLALKGFLKPFRSLCGLAEFLLNLISIMYLLGWKWKIVLALVSSNRHASFFFMIIS